MRGKNGWIRDFVSVFVVFALVFGASLSQHVSESEELCVWNQSCFLPCPFKGQIVEAYWVCEDKPMIPIVYYPENQERHLRGEFRTMSSLSLDQPEGGAVLLLRGVQAQHEGQYRCSVTSSSGRTTRPVHLRLYTPDFHVSLQQQKQQLLCRADRVFPKPSVSWTPLPPDSQPLTSVNASEDGLYSVSSSVSVPQNSAEFTCNISTPYRSRVCTITLQSVAGSSNLKYLWILTVLILIPVGLFIFCCCKKFKQLTVTVFQALQSETPYSLGVRYPSPRSLSTSSRQENGHLNGLNPAASNTANGNITLELT